MNRQQNEKVKDKYLYLAEKLADRASAELDKDFDCDLKEVAACKELSIAFFNAANNEDLNRFKVDNEKRSKEVAEKFDADKRLDELKKNRNSAIVGAVGAVAPVASQLIKSGTNLAIGKAIVHGENAGTPLLSKAWGFKD